MSILPQTCCYICSDLTHLYLQEKTTMNPRKVIRHQVKILTDLPNIGKSIAEDLQTIGIHDPAQLVGKSPYKMYKDLCERTGKRHDPCVIDVFLSITHFMNGEEPKPWWYYTKERKEYLTQRI